jgi:hypothetical protein
MNQAEYIDIMEKALDLSFLRTRLVPGLDLCLDGNPANRIKDLRELCVLHSASLHIKRTLQEKDVEGLYDTNTSEIFIIGRLKNKQLNVANKTILKFFTHELAHAVQYSLFRSIPSKVYQEYFSQFRNELRLEQTAERLAYYIAKNYFPTLSKKEKLVKTWFDTYMSNADVVFIAKRLGYDPCSEEVKKEMKFKF